MNLYQIVDSEANYIMQPEVGRSERKIEELIENNPNLLTGDKLLIIGRQVKTDSGKILDLLAVDKEGRLVVIELKKGYAPREIIAQILDYSSWLCSLSERRIEDIAKNYFQKINGNTVSLSSEFKKFYNIEGCPEIGKDIVNILFAKEFSEEVINPAKYLERNDISIYCIKYDIFEDNKCEYIITDNIVGNFDEYYSGKTEVRNDKRENKQIVKQLVSYLQENYSNQCSELRLEKLFDFLLYQGKDGQWTCAYVDWAFDDGTKINIEFGIKSSHEEGLKYYSCFQSRGASVSLSKKIHSMDSINLLNLYKDESENNYSNFEKYKEVESANFESLKEFSDNEIKTLLKFIGTL